MCNASLKSFMQLEWNEDHSVFSDLARRLTDVLDGYSYDR